MINEDGKKGLAVSLVFHIFCFALVGAVALYSYHTPAKETIYDVALMSGGGDAAPLEDQAEPEEPDEDEEEEEEEVQPAPDDITEERTVVRREHHKSHKKSQSSVHRAAGGTGSGTSDGLGSGGSGERERDNGIEGTAVVRFLIGKDGGVEDLTLARSSGNGSLDQAALNAARGFRFRPGLDGYGRPVRCYAYQPFAFRLR